jgi:acyl-coenzyme A synthetase/AMP-(fatty) acid ligase
MGIETVVMPRFELEKFCSLVQERKITFTNVVPPVVLLLGKHEIVDRYDLSSLRMLNSGAAPLTKDLVDVVHKRLNVPIKQGYGLSETSPVTHEQVRLSNCIVSPPMKSRLIGSSNGTNGTGPSAQLAVCWQIRRPKSYRQMESNYQLANQVKCG